MLKNILSMEKYTCIYTWKNSGGLLLLCAVYCTLSMVLEFFKLESNHLTIHFCFIYNFSIHSKLIVGLQKERRVKKGLLVWFFIIIICVKKIVHIFNRNVLTPKSSTFCILKLGKNYFRKITLLQIFFRCSPSIQQLAYMYSLKGVMGWKNRCCITQTSICKESPLLVFN